MIQIRHLVKDYGPVRALDHLSLDVERGQIVGILGPNGAGKTTALRILTGFLPPTSGSASVNGFDVLTRSLDVRRSIGYLPESTPLYPELRVAEQLHYFGRLHGLDRAARNKRIGELTDRCGLAAILHRPIGHLSKGNRQRVGLAQALLHDPPVLILDEPTVGLDPKQITEVRKLIQSLAETKTVLLSTHILPEVERTCHHVVMIAQGRLVAEGSPQELVAHSRSSSRILLEVKADPAEVEKTLSAIPQVGQVTITPDGAWCKAAVASRQPDQDIREVLGDAIVENRWPLREMRPETADLETFFVQVVSGASAEAA